MHSRSADILTLPVGMQMMCSCAKREVLRKAQLLAGAQSSRPSTFLATQPMGAQVAFGGHGRLKTPSRRGTSCGSVRGGTSSSRRLEDAW